MVCLTAGSISSSATSRRPRVSPRARPRARPRRTPTRSRVPTGTAGPTARSSAVTCAASVFDAAFAMPFVTLRARTASAPSPRPGKMNTLLPWPTRRRSRRTRRRGTGCPSRRGSGNPSTHRDRPGCASEFALGFDDGKITGRSTCAAISRTSALVERAAPHPTGRSASSAAICARRRAASAPSGSVEAAPRARAPRATRARACSRSRDARRRRR